MNFGLVFQKNVCIKTKYFFIYILISILFFTDILNVAKFSKNDMSSIVMIYIFPRQFNFKNAFTSKKDLNPNTLYYIYLDREREINVIFIEIMFTFYFLFKRFIITKYILIFI
jgi:hypothetical protein